MSGEEVRKLFPDEKLKILKSGLIQKKRLKVK